MVVFKRTKKSRQRGSHTHGWGSKKKHRGKGNKGGSGNAGSGKRSDCKKPSFWKLKAEKGFKKKGLKEWIKPVNLLYLEENFDRLLKDNKIKKEDNNYILNLNDLGFNKLLSKGRITKKMIIITKFASKNSIEKVKQGGGEVKTTIFHQS